MAYRYEIFLNYKRGDSTQGWVHNIFYPILSRVIDRELARRDAIFWDSKDIANGAALDKVLKDAVARSKCMISVLTMPYFFESTWCPKEFSAMLFREETLKIRDEHPFTGLIFPIIFVNPAANDIVSKTRIYRYVKLRNLIFNITPLELNKRYFRECKEDMVPGDYSALETIITDWVTNSVLPRVDDAPVWDQKWFTDEYLEQPYVAFMQKYYDPPEPMRLPTNS